ncbi:ABC transporter permease [Halobaculum sp. CBA1158]|uniref:ABC transporter permease n=1 Tax=Halobaculum sp. CBA1158 TaxID=2904243 RepID=UPI001F16E874|nr:ABC transporter permease subunit [Halobaculum sp. CBA1158]UIP00097.1 ABC transporter permease [Halobaculum sp. CBA1158]
MSLEAVARKDFQDAVRSRWVMVLAALFSLLLSVAVYLIPRDASTTALFNNLVVRDLFVTLLVPLIGVVIAYNSVVGERSTGSIKLLLALPHSRADVVFGKVLGRAGALGVPVAISFALPALIALVTPLSLELGTYLGYLLFTVLLGTAFVALAVGFSAAVDSQRIAVAGPVVVFLLSGPIWSVVQFPVQLYLAGQTLPGWLPIDSAGVYRLLRLVNPIESFKILTVEFVNGFLFTAGQAGADAAGSYTVSTEIAALAMLAAWALVPPLIGLWRFEDADL